MTEPNDHYALWQAAEARLKKLDDDITAAVARINPYAHDALSTLVGAIADALGRPEYDPLKVHTT